MPATITFFPVDCGDMTLIRLANREETSVLVDINIRCAADDPNDTTRDVARDLRALLKYDSRNRPYVDAFVLTHPDQDHIRGLQNHFYLGDLKDYPDDNKAKSDKRIVIREMWSSPLVYRRADSTHVLCDDAKAFNKEAKRRVAVNKAMNFSGVQEGDRILVLGEDENGKTDALGPILVKVDTAISRINGVNQSSYFTAKLLAPFPKQQKAEDEARLSKNNSSVILNVQLASDSLNPDGCRLLLGGDAEVDIWDLLWKKHASNQAVLEYDVLLAPHHCSWHSLSSDSWSDLREKAQVNKNARSALAVARQGAWIVASSSAIKDDANDPPCIRAKREYESILSTKQGTFKCVGEHPSEKSPEPLTLNVASDGVQIASNSAASSSWGALAGTGATPRPHG